MMSRLQFYKYATYILLILNIGLVAFFFLTAPRRGGNMQKNKAMELLDMNEKQSVAFSESFEKHREQIMPISKEQRALLHAYFKQLSDDTSVYSDSLLNEVKKLETKKIQSFYTHLEEVKSTLTPEQKPNFEQFMQHILRVVLEENEKRPRPPKDSH